MAGVGEGSPGTSASPGFNFSAKMEGKHSCLPDRGTGESVYNQGRGYRRKEVKPETLTQKYHGAYGSHDPCQIWGNRVLCSRDSRLIRNGRPGARKKVTKDTHHLLSHAVCLPRGIPLPRPLHTPLLALLKGFPTPPLGLASPGSEIASPRGASR